MVGELWRPAGGAYNVDGVLRVMVSGLEEELKARLSGSKVYAANSKSPSSPMNLQSTANTTTPTAAPQNGVPAPSSGPSDPSLPVVKQGADLGLVVRGTRRVVQWIGRRFRKNRS